jgi:hypothetical protein
MTEPQKTPSPLPADAAQALQEIIRATNAVLHAARAESQAVALNDAVAFAGAQADKAAAEPRYTAACRAFHDRAEEFRGMPGLERLLAVQEDLKRTMEASNAALGPMLAKAKGKIRVDKEDAT